MKFPCRLDKFISHLAEIPRTQARASIKRKEVSVNGEVITSHNFQYRSFVTNHEERFLFEEG